MTLIPAFIAMLDNELTSVAITNMKDDRYYTVTHMLPGDEQEYRIEYFDGEPVTLGWGGLPAQHGGRDYQDRRQRMSDKELAELQTAVVAMLKKYGLSAVLISADGEHNRYTKAISNGGGGVFYIFDKLEDLPGLLNPPPVIRQGSLFD